MGHDSFNKSDVTIYIWDMTRSYTRHDSFSSTSTSAIWATTCSSFLTNHTLQMGHDSFNKSDMTIYIWDMTRSYTRHDSFIHDSFVYERTHETWLIHTWLTHSYMTHSWLVRIPDMTHSYMTRSTHSYTRHDSFSSTSTSAIWATTCSSFLTNHTLQMGHDSFNKSDMTHLYIRHDSFIYETWLVLKYQHLSNLSNNLFVLMKEPHTADGTWLFQ